MKVVADTNFFIHYSNFSKFERVYTIDEVIREVKDWFSKVKLSSLNVVIKDPEKEFLKIVEEKTKELGENLSKTDKKVVALALNLNLPLITDDKAMQNVAKQLGIKVVPMRYSLKKQRKIVYICPNCKKIFNSQGICPDCGIKLKRIIFQR